jgi:hypothetical protein
LFPMHPTIRARRIFVFRGLCRFLICREALFNVARFIDLLLDPGFAMLKIADDGSPSRDRGRFGGCNLSRELNKLIHICRPLWNQRVTMHGFALAVDCSGIQTE